MTVESLNWDLAFIKSKGSERNLQRSQLIRRYGLGTEATLERQFQCGRLHCTFIDGKFRPGAVSRPALQIYGIGQISPICMRARHCSVAVISFNGRAIKD